MFASVVLDKRDLDEPESLVTDQERRRHVFVRKLRDRAGAHSPRRWDDQAPPLVRARPPRDITLPEFGMLFAAAEFAEYCRLLLDLLVTLDFGRLGITTAAGAQEALHKFLRCFAAWCNARAIPPLWIACIEMARDGSYHAHIAVYVPEDLGDDGVGVRTAFREWAKGFSGRRGPHVPKAVNVRGGRKHSIITHWIVFSYICKGFDRSAIVCSARNSPDGIAIRLADIIARYYRNPGPVATSRRISISNSIGPARRALGVPTGLDHLLLMRPDWSKVDLFGITELTPEEKSRPHVGIPIPAPFRSTLEDGIYDVQRLYPPEFYEFVTKLPHAPTAVEISEDGDSSASDLTRHLRDLYDE